MQYVASFRVSALMVAAALAACIFSAPAAAVDLASAPATPQQVERLNALVEQVFGGIHEPGIKADAALLDKIQRKGRVPVIVRLRDADLPYGFFENQAAARTEVIRGLQGRVVEDVLSRTGGGESSLHVKRFNYIPAMGMQVNAEELEALLDSSNVIDIVEDVPVPPTLDDSVPLIGADPDGSFGGFTGDGWAVAILDTGVDKTHPFLSGKVVSEACYSSNVIGQSISVCPGGVEASTANGSGVNCSLSVYGCDHGTHVAGIAAGSDVTFSGVAKNSDIIAIQIFSRFDDDTQCGGYAPCVLSWTSDQVLGLERVYALRNTYQIASANMSLGGGDYTTACDWLSMKSDIDTLRTAGIATVIASGNNSKTNAISSPGCVSTAVSVGSTDKSDAVSYYSNSADFLSLFAPGGSIYSSVPGGGYATKSGTSMATPHVAGAWAVLKEAAPGASVTDILTALQDSGVPVTDTRLGAGNRVKPRIDLAAAINALSVCEEDDDCPDSRPFCIDETCVECELNNDCDDSLYCNGAETCSGGSCVSGTAPCTGGAPYCIEAGDLCVECLNSTHCDAGYACEANVCEEDCDLVIEYKPLTAEKLAGKKKGKKLKLKITGGEGFDPYNDIEVPYEILKIKPKVKYKKGVLVKNEVKVFLLVPPDTPAGSFEVRMTPCTGRVDIL